VPVSHTAIAREALRTRQAVDPQTGAGVDTDSDEGRRIARDHMRGYLQLPSYVNAVARRVREHLDGGADYVLLLRLGDLSEALRQLERLAPMVLGQLN
jgi:hypothetical protein